MFLIFSKHKKTLLVVFAVLLVVGGFIFLITNKDGQTFCTTDVKECADGSFVSRSGENCEFDLCPSGESDNAFIKTTDEASGAQFMYQENFPALYISAVNWPPNITVSDGKFTCNNTRRIIEGTLYCEKIVSEGAAGSVYTDNTYTTQKEGKLVSVNVVLQNVHCGNYDEPNKSACEKERKEFDLKPIIDSIVKSIVFDKSLKEKLSECLPKSDMKSKETCDELLASIRTFDDCKNAGFPILESYPEQCKTADGKTFINN
ncbi:hypothetical protein C4565_01895 [Candidatus Parcubacteria bacterium]|jgi:hypothetical protein|nr:MAG: hypothetical protein C4565_01895 [Candidatus Parcubacteria bacterium]